MTAGQRPILFKGWMSVFVNRNDTDEHGLFVIISEICEIRVRIYFTHRLTQIFLLTIRKITLLSLKK